MDWIPPVMFIAGCFVLWNIGIWRRRVGGVIGRN